MFKVPDWGEDIPKQNISFGKKVKKKKEPSNALKNSPVMKPNTQKPHSILYIKNENKAKPKKRKHDETNSANMNTKKKLKSNNNLETQNFNTDVLDEVVITPKKKKIKIDNNVDTQNTGRNKVVINAKKNKNNESIEYDHEGSILGTFSGNQKKKEKKNSTKNDSPNSTINKKINSKKEKIKQILQSQSNRNHINIGNSNKLRERMLERLKAAQFRYLNEKLYTSSGTEAQQLFQGDPAAFQTYHQGYQQQLKKWPVNPIDVIVKRIQRMPKSHLIADMGCGEAALSKRLSHTVRSFDLVAASPAVEACDMARTPLLSASVDVVVYCLALMGTNLTQYLVEANRVLKMGGHVLIAEVESRFQDVDTFTKDVQKLGFKLSKLDKSHKVFFFMEFTKIQDPPAKKSKLPVLNLKPCLYKKR